MKQTFVGKYKVANEEKLYIIIVDYPYDYGYNLLWSRCILDIYEYVNI